MLAFASSLRATLALTFTFTIPYVTSNDARDFMRTMLKSVNYFLGARALTEVEFFVTLTAPDQCAHAKTWVVVHYQLGTMGSSPASPLGALSPVSTAGKDRVPQKRRAGDESPHDDDSNAAGPADSKRPKSVDRGFSDGTHDADHGDAGPAGAATASQVRAELIDLTIDDEDADEDVQRAIADSLATPRSGKRISEVGTGAVEDGEKAHSSCLLLFVCVCVCLCVCVSVSV